MISQTSRQSQSVDACDGLDLKMVGRAEFIKAGRAGWIYKKNQLRQNGDLASLDFVVNDIGQRILLFRGLNSTLSPVVVILCITWHIFFPRIGHSAVFLFQWKQIKLTDSNKTKQHIREKLSLLNNHRRDCFELVEQSLC